MTGKVTVVGAGFYGSTTAQRLAEYDIFDTVVLTDVIDGRPEGIALDLNQARPIEGYQTKVVGQTTKGAGYEATARSDIIVITAGLPRKPGMSRMDLLETNARIVREVTDNVVKHSPDAALIVVSNPLDEMTALASNVSGFPKHRVMGQAGMLDTARFTHFVAEKLGVPVRSVRTLTLGSHGDTMVPVPSACAVDIDGQQRPLTDLLPAETIDELVTRTRNGGAEVVALLKTGSAYYAPSAAAARMARAVAEDSGRCCRFGVGRRRVRLVRRLPGGGGRDRRRGRAPGCGAHAHARRVGSVAAGRRGRTRQASGRRQPLMSSRAFGGLAVVVVVIAAVVGVALGAATAPERREPGGATPSSTAPATTTPPAPAPTQVPTLSIELSGPESAAANNRFELTGVVHGGGGGESLQVERRLGEGEWRGFPEDSPLTSEADADGSFSIGIQTARVGVNSFRIGTPGRTGSWCSPTR